MRPKATDFVIPEELERYRQAVRELVQQELEPMGARLENMTHLPEELLPMLVEAGLLKLPIPRKYGGWGLNMVQYAPLLKEIAKGPGAIRLLVHAWNGLFMRGILDFGTEEMRQKYLPLMAKGEWCAGYALTEPGSSPTPGPDRPLGTFVDLAAAVKRRVRVPVAAVGRLNKLEVAESILAQGKADLIAVGRQLFADAYWPEKTRTGRSHEVRPCLSCNICMDKAFAQEEMRCSECATSCNGPFPK